MACCGSWRGRSSGVGSGAAAGGSASLLADGESGLVGGELLRTVTMIASSGGSAGLNGDIHHTAATASPCSASASPTATGDIPLDLERLDFEWRALTVWATALVSTAPSGRRLAGRLTPSAPIGIVYWQNEGVLGAGDIGGKRRIG